MKKLDRAEFECWLRQQDKLRHGLCPLEHYLGEGAVVGATYAATLFEKCKLPLWATEFTKKIDCKLEYELEDYDAKHVLEILNEQ